MSNPDSGARPKIGMVVDVTLGNAEPYPFHVDVWIDGKLTATSRFASHVEALEYAKHLKTYIARKKGAKDQKIRR